MQLGEASNLRAKSAQLNPVLYSSFVSRDFDDQDIDMDDQEERMIVDEIERVLVDTDDYSNPSRVRRFTAPPERSYRIIQDLFADYGLQAKSVTRPQRFNPGLVGTAAAVAAG